MSKSIAVIGEGKTEWFYFESMRVYCHFPFKLKPGLPKHSDITSIQRLAEKSIEEGYDYVLCVIDMDNILKNKKEKAKYDSFRKKFKDRMKGKGQVLFYETNPCTEFWFLLHFLKTAECDKHYHSADELIHELQAYMPGYDKSEKYFKKVKIYEYLITHGNLERAIISSEQAILKRRKNIINNFAYSQLHNLILLLRNL
jgi:hypothetical protein